MSYAVQTRGALGQTEPCTTMEQRMERYTIAGLALSAASLAFLLWLHRGQIMPNRRRRRR